MSRKINKKDKNFDYDGQFKNIYYETAAETNKLFDKDIVFKEILKFINKDDKICEFGCGDGSKLKHLEPFVKEIWGFDISEEAIKRAKKNVPEGKFFVDNSGKFLKSNQFDVTISMATLEHVENPQKFLNQMIRVVKKGGLIINLCPNFGSPLCPSPPIIVDLNFFQRILLVIKRIKNYHKYYKNRIYKNVQPLLDREWKPDYDTVSEVSLESVVRKYKRKIIYANSFWTPRPYIYFPFFLLSILRVKPVKFWGFLCLFILKK